MNSNIKKEYFGLNLLKGKMSKNNKKLDFSDFKKLLNEFSTSTSIHGLNGISHAHHFVISIVWTLIVLASFSSCVYCKLFFK